MQGAFPAFPGPATCTSHTPSCSLGLQLPKGTCWLECSTAEIQVLSQAHDPGGRLHSWITLLYSGSLVQFASHGLHASGDGCLKQLSPPPSLLYSALLLGKAIPQSQSGSANIPCSQAPPCGVVPHATGLGFIPSTQPVLHVPRHCPHPPHPPSFPQQGEAKPFTSSPNPSPFPLNPSWFRNLCESSCRTQMKVDLQEEITAKIQLL